MRAWNFQEGSEKIPVKCTQQFYSQLHVAVGHLFQQVIIYFGAGLTVKVVIADPASPEPVIPWIITIYFPGTSEV